MQQHVFLAPLLCFLTCIHCYGHERQPWAQYSALETVFIDVTNNKVVSRDLYYHVTIDFMIKYDSCNKYFVCQLILVKICYETSKCILIKRFYE